MLDLSTIEPKYGGVRCEKIPTPNVMFVKRRPIFVRLVSFSDDKL